MTPTVAMVTTARAPVPIERRTMFALFNLVSLVAIVRQYTRDAINKKEGPGQFPFGIDRGLFQALFDHEVAASGESACATPW